MMEETAHARRLTKEEQKIGHELLSRFRDLMAVVSEEDADLMWALRRFIYTRLMHDERGTPMQRKKLKASKLSSQNGECFLCGTSLPVRGAVLDRLVAMAGYTEANTRLLCKPCDDEVQAQRRFA